MRILSLATPDQPVSIAFGVIVPGDPRLKANSDLCW